jgi:transposase
MCEEARVLLEYLPPYSPDFNPIEEAFAEMKAWMRKNRELQNIFEDFVDFIKAALAHMASKAGNHFTSAGYHIED